MKPSKNGSKKMSNGLVDYAYPCMMAEAALKKLHDAMLERKYDEALAAGLDAMVEVKLTLVAIRHEKEKQVQT